MSHPLTLWVTIPAKPLIDGKSRLAPVLPAAQRIALAHHLAQRTLAVVSSVAGIAGVVVVSRDPKILRLAEEVGALPLVEPADGEMESGEKEWSLNRAIGQAAAFVRQKKADALLFLPTDLPLLQARDIDSIVRAWKRRRNCVVIAPSHDGGTNALLLAPPDAIAPAFGLDSFARHTQLARQKGLHIEVVESHALAWDMDTPHEYHLLTVLP